MSTGPGIFEVLAADQSDARLASRKALVLSRDRIDARLGKFLGASRSPQEFAARFDLVSEDFVGIVRVAAREVGHDDPDALVGTLHDHYAKDWIQDAVKKPGDLHRATDTPEGENIPESKIENLEEHGTENEKDKAQFAENVKGLGKGKKKSKKDKKNTDSKPPWLKDDDDDGDDDDDDSLDFTAKTAAPEGNTGLAGPSPKIDKQRWTPKSVPHDEYDHGKHETGDHVEDDVLHRDRPKNADGRSQENGKALKLEQIGDVKTETLPTGKGMDDGGFATGGEDFGPNTDTFGSDSREADPVRSESLEA